MPTVNTVDSRFSRKRDVVAAKTFFRKAFKTQGRVARTITLDGYQASHGAVRELRAGNRKLSAVTVRSCQYLNHILEQGHRVRPMLGFKQSDKAESRTTGLVLIYRFRQDNSLSFGRLRMFGKSARRFGRGARCLGYGS